MSSALFVGYVATVAVLALTPGPSTMLGSAHGMRYGTRGTLPTIAGDLSANALQMLAAGLGLGAIIVQSETLFLAIKWAGVAYLAWMGFSHLRRASTSLASAADEADKTPRLRFLHGFVTSASNPKAIASRRYHEERLAERVESVIPDMPDMFPEHESETESVMPDMPDMFPAMHESESAPASSWAFPFGWSVIAATAFILAVAVGGFLLFGGGPDGGEVAVETPSQPVEAAPDPAADVPAADDPAADAPATNAGSSLESSSSGSNDGRASPAATPTDSQPDVCEVAASQPSSMSFRSPDVGPAISRLFWFVSAFDLGFPTPAFEWEDVPKATTLLLITVQEINDDEAEGIANGTSELVADGWPSAAVRWKATIPSNLTSLDRTWFTGGGEPDDTKVASHDDAVNHFKDAARELPAGVVEWFHGSVIVQVGGEFVANKFAGPDGPGDVFLFTIFALCDPPEVVFDPDNPDARAYRPDWARPHAIDQAWFVATAALP